MTRDELAARIKVFLGFKLGTGLDDQIATQLQQSQVELEREAELPDFLKKKYSSLSTVADTKTLSVPVDFLREFDEDQLTIRNSDNEETECVADSEGELRLRYPISGDTGVPKGYTIVNRVFYFYPTPDEAYSIQGTYYAKDDVLSSGSVENKWSLNLPEILIGKAGFVIASGLRDQTAIQTFAGILGRAMQKLNEMNTSNEAAGSKPIVGGED